MAQIAPKERLLRISKATKSTIQGWAEGVQIETSTGRPISELTDRASADRLALSRSFLKDGEAMMALTPALYRSAISRFYYSMYHAMRAVSYYRHGGDDHERHSVLPGHTPVDFPNQAIWQNALKNARDYRNAADYDPYPKSSASWGTTAQSLATDAKGLLEESRRYLRLKGSRFA